MSEKLKKGMEAIDVAKLLEQNIDFLSWKGDEHIKGVWFNDSHGCTLNKIMAIRVKCADVHKEKMAGNSLFYSLSAIHDRWENDEDGTPIITDQFPFTNMKVKPKKHFLLFDKEEITKKEIESLFELKESHAIIRLKPKLIVDALGTVNNKRDRERSFARLDLKDGVMSVRVLKRKSKRNLITLAKTSVICELLASPILQADFITADINAHTLLYLLNLFYEFSSVAIFITRDRIMITSESCTPNVEVVISRLKTG
jgi:hypothetical protein